MVSKDKKKSTVGNIDLGLEYSVDDCIFPDGVALKIFNGREIVIEIDHTFILREFDGDLDRVFMVDAVDDHASFGVRWDGNHER